MIYVNINLNNNFRIGPSCFYMNISAIYESINMLQLAFSYTNCDFIYNKNSFLKFINPKSPKEYISPDNDLILSSRIDSQYYEDTLEYIDYFCSSIYKFKLKSIASTQEINLNNIKNIYLKNGIPVLFPCDHYYLYEDYKQKLPNFLHFHYNRHMALLVDIDFDNNTAFIIDKFYSFVGNVKLTNFMKAIDAKNLELSDLFILENYNELPWKKDEFEVSKILQQNLQLLSQPQYISKSGTVYHKNIIATEMFIDDFDYIINILEESKGKFAPQFLSKLLSYTILQKISFKYLIKYYNSDLPNLDSIIKLTEESATLWQRINLLNDKTYISGMTLSINKKKYLNLLNNLLEIDKLLMEKLINYSMN